MGARPIYDPEPELFVEVLGIISSQLSSVFFCLFFFFLVLYVLFLVRYKCLLILYIYHVLQVGYHENYYYYYKPRQLYVVRGTHEPLRTLLW